MREEPWIDLAHSLLSDPMSDRRKVRKLINEAREAVVTEALTTHYILDWARRNPGKLFKMEAMNEVSGRIFDTLYGRDWFPRGRHEAQR